MSRISGGENFFPAAIRSGERAAIRGLLLAALIVGNLIVPTNAGWQVQWIDSFDGSGVDWNNWTAQVQANFNNEVQCYTDDDSSPDRNYEVSGGTLKIIARRQLVNCAGLGGASRTWTSGRINSKDKREFLYGRIEARIRFLDLEGGTWPAFWMLENRIFEDPIAGDNDFIVWPRPGAGEIDVWEWFANNPNTYITNFFNTNGCGSLATYTYPGGPGDVQQWHDYAIEWDANTIRFFIDDILVRAHNVAACPQYKEPMFVLLNVAMGGNLGGAIDPALNLATMEVDYVAHCTATSANTAARCNEATPRVFTDLTIFEDAERADWAAWDCCGGSTPGVVIDSDATHAETMEFSINGATVVGFTARAPFAVNGSPLDASAIVSSGTIEFDLKMTVPPAGGATDWKLKVESDSAATAVEVSLATSIEGHIAPVPNQWQHYTFRLSDLAGLGLDAAAIDLVMVFPEFGTGNGAVFRLDNVRVLSNLSTNPGTPGTTTPTSASSSSGGGTGPWFVVLMTALIALRRRAIRSRHRP